MHVSSRNWPFVEKSIKKEINFVKEFNNSVFQFIDTPPVNARVVEYLISDSLFVKYPNLLYIYRF